MLFFSSLVALGLVLFGSAARLPLDTRFKRIQQQNSLLQVGASNEAALVSDEAGRDWVKISSISNPLSAQVGGKLEVTCEAIGSPAPLITWLRDGYPVQYEDSSSIDENRVPEWSYNAGALAKVVSRLHIPCISPRDANAVFTCLASSGLHTALATSTLSLIPSTDEGVSEECLGKHVEQPARIVLHNPDILQTMGRDVLLSCGVIGEPRPTVHWLNSNGHHVIGPHYKVLESGALFITRLTWSDMGEYTCVAQNSQGQDTASTFLYPLLNEE